MLNDDEKRNLFRNKILKKLDKITEFVKNERFSDDLREDAQMCSEIDDRLEEIISFWEY
jgi:hypothetical protein